MGRQPFTHASTEVLVYKNIIDGGQVLSFSNISQLWSDKSMLWIHSQHLKEPAKKFLALCKLYFKWMLIENSHTFRRDPAFLLKSYKNLCFLMIINHFKIRFVNFNILPFNIPNITFRNAFLLKIKRIYECLQNLSYTITYLPLFRLDR
jgi:hypothetical protein